MIKNNLLSVNPSLAKEWDYKKNGKLTPSDVLAGTQKKVWWKCKKGHEWQASINNRNHGSGCPYCANKKVNETNSLRATNPELLEEWDYEKNGKLTPNDVTVGSTKKVWWKCKKGHEYQQIINRRIKYKKCLYCTGYYASKENNLKITHPEIAKEWDYEKNGDLKPEDVTAGSTKKVYFKCLKGHEYKAVINKRVLALRCPFCSNRKVAEDNCLQTTNPELAKEWHTTKNGKLTPNDVTAGSHKKVWWKCRKGHEWQAIISNRKNGNVCPYCANKKVYKDNCLQKTNPELAKEWDYEKNEAITLNNVTASSYKIVWWKCEKGHEWQASIYSRNHGRGCPYCANKRIGDKNNLLILNPKLSKEWNYDKNGDLTPEKVGVGSSLKVWWKCKRGHEWQARVVTRNKGTGCPDCKKGSQTSFPEQALYYYIKKYLSPAKNRYLFGGKYEIDIYLPKLSLAVEYDGIYYHNKTERKKNMK